MEVFDPLQNYLQMDSVDKVREDELETINQRLVTW